MAYKKLCKCQICGKEFEGYNTSRYCEECKVIADRENMKRHREKEKAKREEAKAQARAEALAVLGTMRTREPKPKPEPKKEAFVPNTELCKKRCIYWRYMSGLNCNACHYRVDMDEGVKKDADGKCLCYTPKTKQTKKSWEMPAPSASTLSGYKI